MSNFNVFTGNRLELLIRQLAERINDSSKTPFEQDIIIIPSLGMGRWINLELAKINGISGNADLLFPRSFLLERLLFAFLGRDEDAEFYSREVMTWQIMRAIPSLLDKPGFAPVKSYLDGGNMLLKQYQLSCNMANLFDQYLTFRPDMIFNWHDLEITRNDNERWQRLLWLAIQGDSKVTNYAKLAKNFHAQLLQGGHKEFAKMQPKLPERISLFGFANLPPTQLNLFISISQFIQVDFYYLNPCQTLWEHCFSEKQINRFIENGLSDDEDGYWEVGNPLLASFGTLGREFFSHILGQAYDNTDDRFFHDPGEDSTLSVLQSDILNLQNRGSDDCPALPLPDESIQIHICHSPMREIEVLYDNLLELINQEICEPRKIIVLAPDIQIYAPYIQAIFDAPESGSLKLPYTIADRSPEQENSCAQAFLQILNLLTSRLKADDILNFLQTPIIQQNFKIDNNDMGKIRHWVCKSRISWGEDGKFRQEEGMPGYEQNSWQFGIDRLLLGYAMPLTAESSPFHDQLPLDIEVEDGVLLGKFIHYLKNIFACSKKLRSETGFTPQQWEEKLHNIVDRFFPNNYDTADELQQLTLSINSLLKQLQQAEFTDKLPCEVIKADLSNHLADQSVPHGFLQGGITFCRFLPMRSIPADVIYLLGMNDGNFPRKTNNLSFDLMANKRRPCDRSPRLDDRYLFLESLLSARKAFFISYLGHDIQDNSEMPPAVVVSELCDYLDQAFSCEDDKNASDKLSFTHALQPFSKQYFSANAPLFSFSQENCHAAKLLQQHKIALNIDKQADLTISKQPLPTTLKLEDLNRFLSNPAAYYLKQRLGIRLNINDLEVPLENESFEFSTGLDGYLINQDILESQIRKMEMTKIKKRMMAEGRLPLGNWGDMLFTERHDAVQNFQSKIHEYSNGEQPLKKATTSINLAELTLSCELRNRYPNEQLFYRWADEKAKDKLRAWLYHLAINASEFGETTSYLIYDKKNPKVLAFSAMESSKAKQYLNEIIALYHQNLRTPQLFFPSSSFAYANIITTANENDLANLIQTALSKAEDRWNGNHFIPGDKADPAINYCFGDAPPWEDQDKTDLFQTLAEQIFVPILENSEVIK